VWAEPAWVNNLGRLTGLLRGAACDGVRFTCEMGATSMGVAALSRPTLLAKLPGGWVMGKVYECAFEIAGPRFCSPGDSRFWGTGIPGRIQVHLAFLHRYDL
jgi:hypothetical protein